MSVARLRGAWVSAGGLALIAIAWLVWPSQFAHAWLAAMFTLLAWPLGSMAQRACFGGLTFKLPASSSFDLFRKSENRSEKLCVAAKSISWGAPFGNPNGMGKRPGMNL